MDEQPSTPALSICIAETSADWDLAHHLLNEEHQFGTGRETGDRLCQFVLQDNQIETNIETLQQSTLSQFGKAFGEISRILLKNRKRGLMQSREYYQRASSCVGLSGTAEKFRAVPMKFARILRKFPQYRFKIMPQSAPNRAHHLQSQA